MILAIKEQEIPYENPFEFYRHHSSNGDYVSMLMESRSINLAYGKQSIVVPNAALKITGKNTGFSLEALTETGEAILSCFDASDFDYVDNVSFGDGTIEGTVRREDSRNFEGSELIRQPNASYVIRTVLEKFPGINDEHLGLYGAFAYDFARNFINFGDRFSQEEGQDFSLFLPSTVVYFDDIRGKAKIKRLYFDGKNDNLEEKTIITSFKSHPLEMFEDMTINQYQEKVTALIEQIKNGRMMQCVLSRNQGMSLQQHPIDSYAKLRDINPSPYSFFFSLGDNEYLYGASPEVHINVTDGRIEIRPIAGTVRRSDNPLEDADARIGLQIDKKELREHSMLVDLATSELCRLSVPGSVNIRDLYTLETYPNLYHLVSGVTGELRKGVDALDSLLTTIPAGTLSGAPKAEAMKAIEELEHSRRNFYGGAVGYLDFNGGCNTGITIRSVHVKDGMSFMRAGAGIVAHSTPEGEAREIGLKSEKAMKVLEK